MDAYLIRRFLVDLVPSVLPSSSTQDAYRKYYLKHADDKYDHILVDYDVNITGIIDREWTYTAPPAHAFRVLVALLPAVNFYNGVFDIGEDEIAFARMLEGRGHHDLADSVWNGRLQHRFAFCFSYDLADWSGL